MRQGVLIPEFTTGYTNADPVNASLTIAVQGASALGNYYDYYDLMAGTQIGYVPQSVNLAAVAELDDVGTPHPPLIATASANLPAKLTLFRGDSDEVEDGHADNRLHVQCEFLVVDLVTHRLLSVAASGWDETARSFAAEG